MLKGKFIEGILMVTIYYPCFYKIPFVPSFKSSKITEINKDLICEYSELLFDIKNV